MSLPTSKPAQTSIRSFFQAQQPKYAPPPSQARNAAASRPPPPPAAVAAAPSSSAQSRASESSDASLTSPPPPPPSSNPTNLPRGAAIRSVTSDDIPALRRINALLLPVAYSDSFYQRVLEPGASGRFSRVITWAHDGEEPKVVGAVVCTVEPAVAQQSSSAGQVPRNLYIQSLCLLAPYRSRGLANSAVEHVILTAMSDAALNVKTVTAHVWTENEEALKWYAAHGFRRQDPPIRGYYLKLRPDTAVIVRRDVGVSVRSLLPTTAPPPSNPVALTTTAAIVNLPPMSGPPRSNGATPPPPVARGQSYQNQRAETEWNDLPADMAGGLLAPPLKGGSEPGSGTSSRSSSSARKKRDRSYPAAAFGS